MLLYGEKLLENHLMEETYSSWPEWQKGYVKIKILTPVCPGPGAIYVWKNIKKMCIKSEFKEICLKLAKNGRSDKGFLLSSKVCPQGVFCPCPGALFMYKMCLKSDLEEIILKLATYVQREKA